MLRAHSQFDVNTVFSDESSLLGIIRRAMNTVQQDKSKREDSRNSDAMAAFARLHKSLADREDSPMLRRGPDVLAK